MNNRNYFGHESQLYRVEEHRLIGGKGDQMRLLEVNNGSGITFTVSADRAADISRLSFQGINMSYFSPCGYVGPAYYNDAQFKFLQSFTCGFLTTCGLQSIGAPSEFDGESYGLHGTISHIPAEQVSWEISGDGEIKVHARIMDACIFHQKICLNRTYTCAYGSDRMTIEDTFTNLGSAPSPFLLLYHINLGYPLLSETALVDISSSEVLPRNEEAKKGMDKWREMSKPIPSFEEQCFYHTFDRKEAVAKIYNPTIGKGLSIHFDPSILPLMCEWKMMGERDYVLGLEPGNNYLEGRAQLEQENRMTYIQPGQTISNTITVRFHDSQESWKKA